MKLITRDTDYAVRALCHIVKNKNKIISAHDLVRELKVPQPYLRKILQTLNRERLLKSFRGKNGGFILAIPAEKIYLVDLIRIFQGPLKLSECFFKKNYCPNVNTCILKQRIGTIEKYIISQLRSINITSLI